MANEEHLPNKCAWCEKDIPEGIGVYGMGVKMRPGTELAEFEGGVIPITFATRRKTVYAIVPPAGSDARNDGNDMMFMTCSQKHAELLKQALEEDKVLGDQLEAIGLL